MNPTGEETELASEISTVELPDLEWRTHEVDVHMEKDTGEKRKRAQNIGEKKVACQRSQDIFCSYCIPHVSNDDFKKKHLEKFTEDCETIKTEVRELQRLSDNLLSFHEESKTLHNAEAVKDLRARMDADMIMALQKTERIKVRLEELDSSNVDSRGVEGCGPGTAVDKDRTFAVSAVRKYLKDVMGSFNALGDKISTDYRETMRSRYYSVTGENPDKRCVDHLISTGESETFLQEAIRVQGRDRIADTMDEIQERHGGFRDMEEKLRELHQVFLGMALEHPEPEGQLKSNKKRRISFWGRVCYGTSPKK